MKILLISFLFICIVSFNNCSTEPSTDPSEDPVLIINNGFYSLINDLGESKEYSIEFDYQVIGAICYISGYYMEIEDSIVYSVLDSPRKLIPGEEYSESFSYSQTDYITTSPVLIMGGFTDSGVNNPTAIDTLKLME